MEFLNSGIYVFDKNGNVKSGFPLALGNFWNSSSQHLSDTQIAYDRSISRWLATTFDFTANANALLFAVSNTSDATGSWTKLPPIPITCPANANNPGADQPILGFNQDWVAIDILCIGAQGLGADQLVLIPHQNLTQNPITLNGQKLLNPPFSAARPSRDVSGNAGQKLYLAASVVPLAPSSAAPYVKVVSIDSSGQFGATITSPATGVLAQYVAAFGHQKGCASPGACDVNVGDARVTNVTVQAGADGNHYLMTAFHAKDAANGTTEALWFVGQVESFTKTPIWNTRYIDSASVSYVYPTIAMDHDLEIAYNYRTFDPTAYISSYWNTARGFVGTNGGWPGLLGSGPLSPASSGTYWGMQSHDQITGCYPPTNVRWGDYMTTVWDPTIGTSRGGFWTVQEYSNGGNNEATEMVTLQDPLPYFVGYNIPVGPGGSAGETEVSCGASCNLTFSAPAGAQPGDVFLVEVAWWATNGLATVTAPSGWTFLNFANQGSQPVLISCNGGSSCTGSEVGSGLAFYVYQQGDSGQYSFTFNQNQSPLTEVAGFLVSYRGANNSSANYSAYGYGVVGADTTILTAQALPVPNPEYTLLTLFANACDPFDSSETSQSSPFTSPNGLPNLTVQTPLSLPAENGFLAADTATVAGGSYGQYSTTSCNGIGNAMQVLIPEGNGLAVASGHPLFFAGEMPFPATPPPPPGPWNWYFLTFPFWDKTTGVENAFGWYNWSQSPLLWHADLGWESFSDANDSLHGAWLWDFKLGQWFYTAPSDFPFMYNSSAQAWYYYFPNTNSPGHYTTNPRVFKNMTTAQIIYS